MREGRTLYVLRRRVTAARAAAYEQAWSGVVGAAEECGVNAWRFHAAADPEERLEFLEGEPDFTIEDRGALRAALEALDAAHPPSPSPDRQPWKESPRA